MHSAFVSTNRLCKISLPAHIALSVSIFNIGEDEETGEGILVHKAEMFPAYKGLKFTKVK